MQRFFTGVLKKSYLPVSLLRIATGAILVYASIHKISHPALFARAIDNYMLLPPILVVWTAAILPFMELITGAFLIFGRFTKESALICCGMMTVFLIASVVTMIRGIDIHCGCFTSEGGDTIGLHHLLYQLALITGALLIYFLDGEQRTRHVRNREK